MGYIVLIVIVAIVGFVIYEVDKSHKEGTASGTPSTGKPRNPDAGDVTKPGQNPN